MYIPPSRIDVEFSRISVVLFLLINNHLVCSGQLGKGGGLQVRIEGRIDKGGNQIKKKFKVRIRVYEGLIQKRTRGRKSRYTVPLIIKRPSFRYAVETCSLNI
jgi:hypothetical protein